MTRPPPPITGLSDSWTPEPQPQQLHQTSLSPEPQPHNRDWSLPFLKALTVSSCHSRDPALHNVAQSFPATSGCELSVLAKPIDCSPSHSNNRPHIFLPRSPSSHAVFTLNIAPWWVFFADGNPAPIFKVKQTPALPSAPAPRTSQNPPCLAEEWRTSHSRC